MVLKYGTQPKKALYLGFQLAKTAFISIPIWLVVSLPKSWRPDRSWSYTRTLWVQILRRFVDISEETGLLVPSKPPHKSIQPGKNVNGIWIEPVPPELVTEDLKIWSEAGSVRPVRIPGYWMDKDNSAIDTSFFANEGEKVILSFHGGSYYTNSAHPTDRTSAVVREILANTGDTVRLALCVEYRLSTTHPHVPSNPFPAALLDGLAAYHYLVNEKQFRPENIIIEGDSAGGNLALAVTRYLVENRRQTLLSQDFPLPPGGLVLLSPWCDIGTSHDVKKLATILKNDYDPEPTHVGYVKLAFTGPWGMAAAELNPYISPASRYIEHTDFAGFPRTFISVGGAENLLEQIRELRERMVKGIGEAVTYCEAGTAPHDFLLFDSWTEPEKGDTLRALRQWFS